MKKALLLPWLLVFITGTLTAQEYACNNDLSFYKVINKSGISLFAEMDGSSVLASIPYDSKIAACHGSSEIRLKVFFKDWTGYVEKEYLEIQEPVNVAILSHWMGDGFPVANQYYGIFRNPTEFGDEIVIEKCKTVIDSIMMESGDYNYVSDLVDDKKPHILISGLEVKTGIESNGEMFDSKFLYPGESVLWQYGDNQYLIYARGEMEENTDTASIAAFSGIRNYEFHVKRIKNGKTEDKILYKRDFRSWNPVQFEGGIYLHWIGDIDGDKELDMIITVSGHYACWEVSFFLSSQAEPGYFFKEVTNYQECGC